MTRRTRIVAVVLGLTVLAVAAGVVLFDWNVVKPYAERRLSASTGREVTLNGNLRVAVSLSPTVHVDRVRIANPPWAREKQMLEADAVDVTFDLMRFARGEYYLSEVVLTRPTLALEIGPDGRHNWYLDQEQQDPGAALRVGRLRVDEGSVVFHQPAEDTEIHATVSTMNAPDGQANVAFNATGRLRGLPLAAHGSGGSVLALRDDSTPYPIRFQATLGHTVADVDGTVTGLVALTAADVQLALKGNNLEQLYPLFRVALPATPPYRVAGHLRHRGNRTDYEKFTGRMGGSDLSGGLSVLAGNPPSVQADVVSNTLDLADLGPLIGTPAKGQAETTARTDRLLPDEPFHVDRWKSVNMDIRFRGTHLLHAAQMPLDNLSAHAVLKDGVLRVDPLRFGAVGGEFNSTVVFDGNSDPLQARVDAHVRKLQLARVAPSMKIPNATVGDISGDIHLRGRGNSVARMLSSADGRLGFAVTDGEVSKLLLKLVGLDLGGYIATRVRGDREIPIRCAVASFDAHHGVLDTNVLVLDTPDTNVLGAGDISLASETLNLTLRPQPKKHSLLSLRTPLYVKGSFSHPSVGVNKGQLAARGAAALGLAALNPAAGLVPLIETGPGRDSNCGELVAQVQEQSGRGAPAQRKPG